MDKEKLKQSVELFLEAIGEDVNSEGLKNTPQRIVDMWEEMLKEKEITVTTFTNPGYNEMICKADIRFFSFCEHHILPFFGMVDIAYIPKDKIVGLSKLARIVRKHSIGLKLQEKLTNDIAEDIMSILEPLGVMVVIKAQHLCEMMRGIKDNGRMITSAVRGEFLKDADLKEEFLKIIK